MESEQSDQNQPSNQEQFSEEGTILETRIVFDGNCDHYYEPIGKDPEGINEAACKKCHHGRRYTDEYECRDGRITAK